jgi:predicted transposase/invertase (TIGR01784 family)
MKIKTLKELNLEDDFLFAKVMRDESICKEFLEKLLEINIKELKIIEEQKVIDLDPQSKSVRLDIYVKDENETVYNIEMQRGSNKNLPKRLRYYQGNIDMDLIQRGDNYIDLVKSYVIFICTFDLFKKGRHKYTFETICKEDTSIKLEDDAYKIILNTKGILNDMSEELIDFLEYVDNSDDETANHSSGTLSKNIHKKVLEIKNNPKMEVEYMTILERDRLNREEGIQIGLKQGLSQGLTQGKLVGRREAFIEMAKSLIGVLPIDVIAKKTGLTEEEVLSLERELKN